MSTYEKSLILLYELFKHVGEQGWAEEALGWIVDWQQNKRVSFHRYALYDLYLCELNHHKLTKEQEAWANALLLNLRGLCMGCAEHPEVDYSEEDLKRMEDPEPSGPRLLSGDRCLDCGYPEINSYYLHQALAYELLPGIIYRAVSSPFDRDVVRRILSFEIEGLDEKYQELSTQVRRSGIAVTSRKGWLRPCPRCSSNDTAAYRWLENDNGVFEPSADNLPLNRKG
ncbi:MAG: hypothetical protein ACYC6A_02995 [Armatimonadota bacterium]